MKSRLTLCCTLICSSLACFQAGNQVDGGSADDFEYYGPRVSRDCGFIEDVRTIECEELSRQSSCALRNIVMQYDTCNKDEDCISRSFAMVCEDAGMYLNDCPIPTNAQFVGEIEEDFDAVGNDYFCKKTACLATPSCVSARVKCIARECSVVW